MTPEKIELIALIKEEGCIWNENSKDYRDKVLLPAAWERVAKRFFTQWDRSSKADKEKYIKKAKKKWAYIKFDYNKELDKKKKRKQKRSVFSTYLHFLDPKSDEPKEATRLDFMRKVVVDLGARIPTPKSSSNVRSKPVGHKTPEKREQAIQTTKKMQLNKLLAHTTSDDKEEEIETSKEMRVTRARTPKPEPSSNEVPEPMDNTISEEKKEAIETSNEMQVTHDPVIIEPNVAFLLRCSLEMETLTPCEQLEFKLEVMNLIKDIRFPKTGNRERNVSCCY